MSVTFRQFIKSHPFSISLREDEAAPSIGQPSQPSNPETTNKHHFDSLQRHLGIGDKELEASLEGDALTIWKVPDYSSKWGFMVNGPVQASVTKRGDGGFDVMFLLKQKQLMEPKSLIRPYKQGDRPMYYEGPVQDKTERMTEEDLQDAMTAPFNGMPSGGGAPMGGPPGGAPMGGPPMGGI